MTDVRAVDIAGTLRSPGRTITESDLVRFATISGDWMPIHVDREAAAASTFGQRVAHGPFVASVAAALAQRAALPWQQARQYDAFEWRARRPVLIGDTLHVEVSRSTEEPAAGTVALDFRVLNQRGEEVGTGRLVQRICGGEAASR